MSRIRRIVVAAALAAASVVPLTVAEAMPVANAPAKAEKASDVQQARWCGRWRCGYRRHYHRRYWGPRRVWIAPRVIVRPRVVVRTGYSRHVRWCMNNYQSYDVNTDTFISYEGDERRCRSPFR
jgi:hypothetical protein